MVLFGVIALVVLGPDRLIVSARTLGRWYGKFRRISARLQSEIVSELQLQEVQSALQAEIAKIRESEAHMKAQMDELQRALDRTRHMTAGETTPNAPMPSTPSQMTEQTMTTPMVYHFFLLGDYDRKRRLPPPPFLPDLRADKLLYQMDLPQ